MDAKKPTFNTPSDTEFEGLAAESAEWADLTLHAAVETWPDLGRSTSWRSAAGAPEASDERGFTLTCEDLGCENGRTVQGRKYHYDGSVEEQWAPCGRWADTCPVTSTSTSTENFDAPPIPDVDAVTEQRS